jgi:hypothetical protein
VRPSAKILQQSRPYAVELKKDPIQKNDSPTRSSERVYILEDRPRRFNQRIFMSDGSSDTLRQEPRSRVSDSRYSVS